MSIIESLDITQIVKLIALQSLVSDGLKKETLDTYKRLIVDTHGSNCLPWLMCLQQAGLIREKAGQTHINSANPIISGFAKTAKQMRLLVDDVHSTVKPTDAAYFYAGYASLLVRHLEGHDRTQWKTVVGDAPLLRSPKKMLFVIGGLTMAEIASIRFSLPDITAICVTSTVTGTQLVRSFDQHGFAFKDALRR
uniref:Transcriptional regulator n=1 Tax=Steinernema glaseri TaxID=37863 RepID=A0A1I7YGT0_9BILA